MPYFIFNKNQENIIGSVYKICETENDLNNLNIIKSDYKIIEDSQENFNAVKYGTKFPEKFNSNDITYSNHSPSFIKEHLVIYVNSLKQQILQFINNNPNHPLNNIWNNYYNQLNSLDLNSITYPLNKSLEQYFYDLGQPSYNILQIP
jgi:hypothetical protein